MYWTHLIFALLHGLLISWNKISASKPGYLDFDNLPETNFSCDGKVIGGYYADVETGCQMFHVCTIGQKAEVTDIKFLCLNGTVFDQETRVCERIDEVDCAKSEDFFGLNLELYGNNANFGGIQAENEFETEGECEGEDECVTDEEYEESEEATTLPATSTTTTTQAPSTTRPTPSTTRQPPSTARPTPTTARPYQGDPLQALLALHSAFNKPAPPRVINNAFSPTAKPTPARPYPTRRPPDLNYKSRYTPDSQSYGSLNLQQRERPYYFTPATEKSNYHHFHSGDTSFGHSFDATRPYNFQYFHSRKLPEDKPSVSVVTSTSTSTSIKTSKDNATEYPTGYEDYQDDIQDHAYFEDVPKVRQKRELHPNHKYDDVEVTTPRHKNHKYNDELTSENVDEREEFLQNLLGSIDLDEQVREKMTDFFKKEDKEIESIEKGDTPHSSMENKIGQIFTQEIDLLKSDDKKSKTEKLTEWTKHFDEMTKDINLNYTFEVNFTNSNDEKSTRQKRHAQRPENTRSTVSPPYTDRSQPRRTNIDTEQFRVESRRRKPAKNQAEFKPVSESIEDDLTTIEYRRSSKTGRSQPRTTASLRSFTFNYEVTSAIPESEGRHSRISKLTPTATKEIVDFVHEEIEHPAHLVGREEAVRESSRTESGESMEDFVPRGRNNGRQRQRVVVAKRTRPLEQSSLSSNNREVEEVPRRAVRVRQQGERRLAVGRPRQEVPVEVRQELPAEARQERPVEVRQDLPVEFRQERPVEVRQEHPEVRQEHPVVRQEHPVVRQEFPVEVRQELPVEVREERPVGVRQELPVEVRQERPTGVRQELPVEVRQERPTGVRRRPVVSGNSAGQRGRSESGEFGRGRETPKESGEMREINRGAKQGRGRVHHTSTAQPTLAPRPTLMPDPEFSCEGRVKGGFYADTYNDCRAFFICSQGEINGPLLKSHFACGDKTRFNQRSRTCQAEDLVECEISSRYFHLNNDFLVPVSEDELRGSFEPLKER